MIDHPNKSRSRKPPQPKYDKSEQHDIFDKRVISYWTLFRTWPTGSCDYIELIRVRFFFSKRFLRVPRLYRKIPDNYFINGLLFPTSSSHTNIGL